MMISNKNFIIKPVAFVFFATLFFFNTLTAQIGAGGDAFIQGTSVEIGVELLGGYEGGNSVPPVTGSPWHFRGAVGLSGFVADPLVSGWTNYNGDFYTPGSPENGWGILIGSSAAGLQLNCNRSGSLNNFGIGNTIAYLNNAGAKTVCWSGAAVSGTNNITANITYSLGIGNLYYTTTVRLTNNSAGTIPEMYYYKNLDPDNNQSIGAGFVTTNSIVSQPSGLGSCGIAAVQATQPLGAGFGASYMALAGVGLDFRVSKGGFANRNGFNIWNAVIPLNGVPGTVTTADEAISISYKIQSFLPGTSRFFSFVTVLRSTDINLALGSLLAVSYPGATASGGSACTPGVSDTAKICGPTLIEIAGAGSSNYSWSWNPPIGISSSTTYSTIASPTVITSYTITGTPIPGPCAPGAPSIYTIVVQPLTPTIITTPSITVCTGSPIFLTTTSGPPMSTYGWVGPAGFTSSVQNPTIAISTLSGSGTYTITKALTCEVALTDVLVTPPPTLTLSALSNSVCTGVSTTLTAISSSGSYNWNPAASLSSSTTPVVVASPTTTTNYTVIVGAGTCTNSAVTSVSVVPTPTLTVSSATICAGSTATLTASGATSYTWSSGSSTNVATYSPAATTVFTVTGANGGVCNAVKSTTVTVIDYPVVNTSTTTNLNCNGISTGSIVLNATGATGYNWTPNVSTSSTAAGLAAGIYTCVLTVAPSCSIVTTYTVTEPTAVIGATSYTNTSCGNCNGNASIIATGGTGSYTYNWMPSALTQTNVTGLCPNNYSVSVTDANNCVSNYTLTILPSPVFQATATATNLELYQGESITLAGHTGTSYTWTPVTALNCYTCATTIAKPMEDTRYCVDIKTSNGCRDTACVDIVILCGDIFVPSAYSPNGDGHNDELAIFGNCIVEIEFRIFDRWGEMVFETKDVHGKWDGKYKGYAVTAGVFVYQLKAKLKNGESVSKTGNITVVR